MTVLTYNRPADFQGGEKSKGGRPSEIEIFLLKGVGERGCRGGQEPAKTLHLFNQQKNKISNLQDYNT